MFKSGGHRLAQSGKKVGTHEWPKVLEILDGALGEGVKRPTPLLGGMGNYADLDNVARTLGNLDVLGREIHTNGPAIKQAFGNMVSVGSAMANEAEAIGRTRALLELLETGMDPVRAYEEVGRLFVDYSVNSEVERFLRDVIPFAKFSLGALRWSSDIARRPALVNWMGRVQGSTRAGEGEDVGFVPERVSEGFALPLPWLDRDGNRMFLTSLGLPLESTLTLLGSPTTTGFRRNVLAGINPVLRSPMEATVNRSFYFGDEWAKYRRAPQWIPKQLAQKIELPNGEIRYEIPGEVNELLNALPASRVDSMVNKLVDSKRGVFDKLLNSFTGARTMSVDTRRELENRLVKYLRDKAASGQVGEALIYFDRLSPEDTPEDLKLVLRSLRQVQKEKRKEKKIGMQRGLGF